MAGKYSVETIFKAVDKMSAPVSRMQANVGRFSRSAQDGMRKVADVSQNLIGKTIKLGGVLGTAFAAGVAGLAAFVTMTNSANAEIDNMSAAMGVQADTTRAMGGVLSSMTMNWENFTDLLEEQTNKFGELKGAGEMKKLQEAIDITGLSVAKLKKMNPEEQFIAIADSLVKMKDGQKAAFIADEIWGGEGNKVIQGLRARKMTVSQVIAEYQKYNFYTKEGQQATRDFNAAMKPLNQMISTSKDQLAGLIGGALTPYIKKATDWAAANKEIINSKLELWAQKLADALVWLVTNSDKILLWAKYIGIALGAFIAFVAVLRTLILVMTAVNLVMAMNPIVLITLAVIALVAAVGYLIYKFFGLQGLMLAVKVALVAVGTAVLGMMGPIGWLIGAAILIWRNWDVLGPFFSNLWSGIVGAFSGAKDMIGSMIDWLIDKVTGFIRTVTDLPGKVKGFFTGGGSAAEAGANVNSPQKRTADSIRETRNTSEVTIKDETKKAKVTKGDLGKGVRLQHTGKP